MKTTAMATVKELVTTIKTKQIKERHLKKGINNYLK